MNVNPEKKLTAKIICGNVSKIVEDLEEGEQVTAYQIGGVVEFVDYSKGYDGSQSVDSWVRFNGEFLAENFLTGKFFTSNKAFIHEPFQSLLIKELDAGKQSIEFGYLCLITKSKSSPVGYTFHCESIKEMVVSDRLSGIKALFDATRLPPPPPPTGKPPVKVEDKTVKRLDKGKDKK